jgi:PAS domain S-box-containing protein
MPDIKIEQKKINKIPLDQEELSLSRMLLLGLTIEFMFQLIINLLYTAVQTNSIIIFGALIITALILLVGSYRSYKIESILSNKQYLLYLFLFAINWMVLDNFGDYALNNALAMSLVFLSLVKSKTVGKVIITMLVSLVLYLAFYFNLAHQTDNSSLTIFLTLFFGVTILQITKISTDKRFSTFEKSLSSVLNNLSEPFFIVNKTTLDINYSNVFATNLLGNKDEKLEGKFSSLVAPDSMTNFNEVIKHLSLGDFANWNGEIELVTVNNKKVWVSFRINLVRFPDDEKFIIKIQDISQEKYFEEQLKKSLVESEGKNNELVYTKKAIVNVMEDMQLERDRAYSLATDLEKFKMAVANASDHIVITDPDGIVLYANAAVAKITGYSSEEVIGKKAGTLWSTPMDESFYKEFWDVIKIQKRSFEGEIINKKKNGVKYFAQVSVTPILDDNGEVEFFVGIERDITKSKEIDSVRSEFVSVASHQLRTPLTSIKWYIEILQGDNQNFTDAQKDIVKEISTSNIRMINLVNDLLNVSRIETGEKYKITKQSENVITILKTVVNDQQMSANAKKISINFDNSGFDEFIMEIDKDKLYQSIANLINNAIKYSPENSSIDFKFVKSGDNEVTISVQDHGIGIPESGKSRVFEKFFRAENAVKKQTDGSGLGLYFARAIVIDHKGTMEFDSVEGKGTTFTVKLPIR